MNADRRQVRATATDKRLQYVSPRTPPACHDIHCREPYMRRAVRIAVTSIVSFISVMLMCLVATRSVSELAGATNTVLRTAYRIVIPSARVRRTRAMNRANVRREVARALKRGDYRLVGIGGLGLFFPGLEGRDQAVQAVVAKFGYRFIDGTSDYAENAEQATYQSAAYNYARRYNLLLWPKLQARSENLTH